MRDRLFELGSVQLPIGKYAGRELRFIPLNWLVDLKIMLESRGEIIMSRQEQEAYWLISDFLHEASLTTFREMT